MFPLEWQTRSRQPVAYPVYLSQYENERQQFSRSTGVKGLYSIGRNGEFAHLLMEDVYVRTLKRTAALAASMKAPPSGELASSQAEIATIAA